MCYKAVKTNELDIAIDSREWERANVAVLGVHRWQMYAKPPYTEARVLCTETGVYVRMHSEEKHLRMQCKAHNGRVCEDSCMEFFFTPGTVSKSYMNFEINPLGTVHLGLGEGRGGRTLIPPELFHLFHIETATSYDGWTAKFFLPYTFLQTYFGALAPVWRCNFYKCGDKTEHPHYGTWREVKTDAPDFHQSAFFGTMMLEGGTVK